MHILFCSSYPHLPETRGGLQSSTDELCIALGEKGVSVTVLCGTTLGKQGMHASRDPSLGYPVVRAEDPLAALPLVAAAIEPSIILVQSSYALAPLLAAAVETGVPSGVYLHNVELHRVGGILPPHSSIFYLANSQFTAERWKSLFGIACRVLPPAVRGERYLAQGTGDRVLFVNPVPEKGFEYFLSIAAGNPDIPFLLVDSWNAGDDWRAWVKSRLSPLANVEWRAATENMREIYSETRFLLMPSVWEEAYGRTVVEAQINGLPVLVSDRGALPATVGQGGVILSLTAGQTAWRDATRRLYFDVVHWGGLSEAAKANSRMTLAGGMKALDDVLMELGQHALSPWQEVLEDDGLE